MDFKIFLRGLIVGFSIAAPVGPIGVLCIRRTLAYGRRSGFISGLGAASADAVYGSIAAFGLTIISSFLVEQKTWLGAIGGAFLCYLGIKTILEKPSNIHVLDETDAATKIDNQKAEISEPQNLITRRPLWVDYASVFLLTMTNPMTILAFAAIFAGMGVAVAVDSRSAAMTIVLGVFMGSALWWLVLSGSADLLRVWILKPTGLRWVNRISGIIIAGFGVAALVNSLSWGLG